MSRWLPESCNLSCLPTRRSDSCLRHSFHSLPLHLCWKSKYHFSLIDGVFFCKLWLWLRLHSSHLSLVSCFTYFRYLSASILPSNPGFPKPLIQRLIDSRYFRLAKQVWSSSPQLRVHWLIYLYIYICIYIEIRPRIVLTWLMLKGLPPMPKVFSTQFCSSRIITI